MAGVARGSLGAREDRPLPSFEMPWLDAVDPDRTLKRRALRPFAPPPSAGGTEEISVEDVLEVVKSGPPQRADATQEIRSDDIIGVAVPALPEARRTPLPPISYPTPLITVLPEPPVRTGSAQDAEEAPPPSVAPVALDVLMRPRGDSLILDDTPSFRRPRMSVALASGIGAIVGIAVLVLALGSAGARPIVQRGARQAPIRAVATATAASASAPKGAANAPPRSAIPTLDVSTLPQAPVGTVALAVSASSHRLFVDGAVVAGSSAIVSCGKHIVKVGSRGRQETVDVPCGGEVVLSR